MITKNIIIDNNRVHYTKRGAGPPVILVHGFAASNYDWAYLEPELVKNGYQVYAPDLIGHGNSIGLTPKTGFTFNDIYKNFSNWNKSQEYCQEITLIGHSLGGLVSLYYAIQNPNSVRDLILINPFYSKKQLNRFLRYVSGNPEPYRKALQVAPTWLIHTIISLDLRGYVHYEDRTRIQKSEDITRAAPEIVYIPGSIPQVSDRLTEVQSPTCVIWGTKDFTLNPKSFPELVNRLPNATSVPINGTGHQPHLSQSEQLNRIVIDFLADQYSR
jgi:pimeloyl-ACP methyl ester carboxylesterase